MNFIVIVIVLVLIGLVFWFARKKEKNDSLLEVKKEIETIRKEISDDLWKTSENSQRQLQNQVNLIREMTEELVKVNEGHKQVLDITNQLKNLQDIFKNPKQRGVVGEFYLETLLHNVMPPDSYKMQYSFSDGTVVDAVIFIKDRLIPVDSKLSFDNYNRLVEAVDDQERQRLEKIFINDLKLRINEASKYIRTKEGTTDFVFMFLPHEAIYYDLLINKIGGIDGEAETLIQRAAGRQRVIIVSPTSFLAYLQTVLQGLKALKIEDSAKIIIKRVEELRTHLLSYEKSMNSLGRSMSAAMGHYNRAEREFQMIDKDIYRITGQEKDESNDKGQMTDDEQLTTDDELQVTREKAIK